ncbi:MAG TPA: hypothetical protein PLG57_10060, partial [Bacteroidia bacterium]|nr:hypothetical protein [Bacteroidia bacterium]
MSFLNLFKRTLENFKTGVLTIRQYEDFEKFLERIIRGSNRIQKGIKKPRRRGLKIFQNRSLQSVNEDFKNFSERSIRGTNRIQKGIKKPRRRGLKIFQNR